MILEKGT